MSQDLQSEIQQQSDLPTSKFIKFIAGCFITLLSVYMLAFVVLGAVYVVDVFSILLLYSIFFHLALFPFVLYGVGGIILLCLADTQDREVLKKSQKFLMIGLLLGVAVTAISEWAHVQGILQTRFILDWK